MKVAVTGVPGTGKTTATEELAEKYGYDVAHLNLLAEEKGLFQGVDEKRGVKIVDLEEMKRYLPEEGVLESHYAHKFKVDRIILLRCHPSVLGERIEGKERKVTENQEAEALDQILVESLQGGEPVDEIDTTHRTEGEIADLIRSILEGEAETGVGNVDWSNWLMEVDGC